MCGNHVKNGRDRGSETFKICLPKVALLKIPMDSVQYNTEHCGMHDDTDDKHRVRCSRNRSLQSESFVLMQ